ncbi:MAG TPA: hypothetical protein VKU92_06680 [Acidimicrobiales bacterium]|nr:hypothetical protein [Acidimicrobiales bacterium]
MEVFVGRHDRTLDAKGRVVLPARWRGSFQHCFLAPHEDGCIALWTAEEFAKEAERQHLRESEGAPARHDVRDWFARATDVDLDAQGRMQLPPDLRAHARIDGDVLFVGVHDRVELWSRQRWESRRDPE